jgi:hypothetical protein
MVAKVSRRCATSPICQTSPTQTFFLPRAKSELAGLSLSQDQDKSSVKRSFKPSPMTSSLTPFGDGWTAAKNLPASGITKPKKIPKTSF